MRMLPDSIRCLTTNLVIAIVVQTNGFVGVNYLSLDSLCQLVRQVG